MTLGASHFGWVDFSERNRQQMLDVIEQFRDEGARDELGLGTIRDALGDHFFPGTSTIQTRTRYFLFVPWTYRDLERRRRRRPRPSTSRSASSTNTRLAS